VPARVLVGIVAGVIGVFVVGCGGETDTYPHNFRGRPLPPAQLADGGSGKVSDEFMDPQTSFWTVDSDTRNTEVDAGGAVEYPSDGLFWILRSWWGRGHTGSPQTVKWVRVPGSGPVTITRAPLGQKIAVSAQKHGNIEFKGKNGITGTLHLRNDTVTLDR
jgi:hypothetical protein